MRIGFPDNVDLLTIQRRSKRRWNSVAYFWSNDQ
jgi:hypothetical protein